MGVFIMDIWQKSQNVKLCHLPVVTLFILKKKSIATNLMQIRYLLGKMF